MLAGVINTLSKGNQRVIDIGCGKGTYSILAAQHSNDVLGVDLSIPFFPEGTKKMTVTDLKNGKLNFVQSNILELPISAPYDAALCIGVLHYLKSDLEVKQFIQYLKKLLKKSSLLYLSWISDKINYYTDKFLPPTSSVNEIIQNEFNRIFQEEVIIEHQHGNHPLHKHQIEYLILKIL